LQFFLCRYELRIHIFHILLFLLAWFLTSLKVVLAEMNDDRL
jgi:hypothetical protein